MPPKPKPSNTSIAELESPLARVSPGAEPSTTELLEFMKTMKSDLSNEFQQFRADILKTISTQADDISKISIEQDKMKEEIVNIKLEQNDKEQRMRNYSIRVFNLPVPNSDRMQTTEFLSYVYNNVIDPILQEALKNKDIPAIPPVLQLIEYGHPLRIPKNAPKDSPPTIILRFFSRTYRSLIFKYKKKVLDSINSSRRSQTPAPYPKIFINEDLSPLNFSTFRTISQDERVERCFTINGVVKFVLNSDPEKRLRNIRNPFNYSLDV